MKTRLFLGVCLALLAMSCKEGPAAGELAVDLTTPNSDDGAIQFMVSGSNGATIAGLSQACSGCKLFQAKVNESQYKGAITGNLSAGTLFRVAVSDAKHPSIYTVTIVGVSNRAYGMRNSLTGYSITLR